MAFIKNVVSLFSPAASTDPFPDSVPFTDTDPCAACADPCTAHPQLPAYLAKKIEKGPLVGTAGKPYKRHIMVVEGSGRSWPERLENTDGTSGITPIIGELAAQVGERVGYRTIVTAAESFGSENSNSSSSSSSTTATSAAPRDGTHTQLMLFPDLLRIPNVTAQTAAELVPALLEHGTVPPTFAPTAMRGKAWIFVCTHKKRDKRCGVAGPMLVDEFRKAVAQMKLEGEVEVYGCSHFGGHKFAGNIIIYHRNPAVDGNWYGRVKTCHVRPILETTINEGKVFKELWRGAMQRDDAIADQNRAKVLAGDW
ncbi:hypothetical protein HDU87_000976 [Geranomyces variabilis]|uniref:Uncharacterized protein n=1 Tax=Geranomyces variabilis TaxID=109894 RepID=A0AAD5TBT2_9FUNG|nr:hypothetical protein HDU87_000976 [Geranomyces variabilis]